LLAELKSLVAVAAAGSMERAAKDLHLTPSALTRRIQRLEIELDTVLLDRHFKPPKLTLAGFAVLQKSRVLLASLEELKASTCADTSPVGPFRLGLSYALARPDMSKVIIELGNQFPALQPSICTDTSPQMLARLHLGELDGAVVILPANTALPNDLEGITLSQESMRVVQARAPDQRKSIKAPAFYRRNWVLNPVGCLVREEIRSRVERLGVPLMVAAELHNPDLQVSLIAANMGVGLLRASFLRTHSMRTRLNVIEHPSFNISIRIAFYRGRHLGIREKVAIELQQILLNHYKSISEVPRRIIRRGALTPSRV
jgi:DNA-binding transcriptional LysR family regulator